MMASPHQYSSVGSFAGGGAYALTGFVYQLLGSLDWATQLALDPRELAKPAASRATMVLEPRGGGDAIHGEGQGAIAVQFKATVRKHWTSTGFVTEVLHDLFAAARAPSIERFRLHTNAPLGFGEDFHVLLRCLRQGEGGLASAEAAGLSFRAPGLQCAMGSRAYCEWMLGRALKGGSIDAAARARFFRVMAGLDFVADQSEHALISRIEERLGQAVIQADVRPARLLLVGALLEEAKQGNRRVNLAALMDRCRIPRSGLARSGRAERQLAEHLALRLDTLGYAPEREARLTPALAASGAPLALCGPSGVGKTWELARAAQRADREGALVIWIDEPASRTGVRREVADRLAAPLNRSRLGPHGVRAAIDTTFGTMVARRVCIFLDRFPNPDIARSIMTDPWWAEQRLEMVAALPAAEYEPQSLPQTVLGREVSGFSHRELHAYCKSRGLEWKALPDDLRELLRRPILAKLYADRGGRPGRFDPASEYELVAGGWMRPPDGFGPAWKSARAALESRIDALAADLLAERIPAYPWRVGGDLDPAAITLLERQGLMRWTLSGQVVLDHDRWLAWGLARALAIVVETGPIDEAALGQLVERCWSPSPYQSLIPGHALSYLPLDLLWRLTRADVEPSAMVMALVARLARNGQFEWDSVATLGPRGVRIMIAAAEMFADEDLHFPHAFGAALAKAVDGTLTPLLERRVVKLLRSSDRNRRMLALVFFGHKPRRAGLSALVEARDRLGPLSASKDFQENDAIFEAAEALLNRWPTAIDRLLERSTHPERRRTLAWMIVGARPSLGVSLDQRLVDLIESLPQAERKSLEPKCLKLIPSALIVAQVTARAPNDGFAFEALSAVDPKAALSVLAAASGSGLEKVITHLGVLIRQAPGAEALLLGKLRDGDITADALCFRMSDWEGRVGEALWTALCDAAEANLPWRVLRRLADTPNLALLDALSARRGGRLEQRLRSEVLGRSAQRKSRNADHDLDAAEAVLLRIGGAALQALTVQRLVGNNDIEQHKGLDACLITDSRAVVDALVRLAHATAQAPNDKASLRPFQHLAMVSPKRAAALAHALLARGGRIPVWAAGEIAVRVEDRPLCAAVLTALRGKSNLRNNWLELRLLAAWGEDDARARRVAQRALTGGDDWGRSLAAWTALRLDDDRLLSKVAEAILSSGDTFFSRRDIATLGDLAVHPRLGPSVVARLEALPKKVRRRLLADDDLRRAWGQEDWVIDDVIGAALQFESGYLNTPRDGQDRLWRIDPGMALEAFDEGLRRGGRASEGLARRALRNAPEQAAASILARFDQIKAQKVRDDVARALRTAPDLTSVRAQVAALIATEGPEQRLAGLELAGWIGGEPLYEAVLGVLKSDPRGEIDRRASAALERMDQIKFLAALRARIEASPAGSERRRLMAIAARADTDRVMFASGDPLAFDADRLDAREWRILERIYEPQRG